MSILIAVLAWSAACGDGPALEKAARSTDDRVSRVEHGLCQPLLMEGERHQRFSLEKRMQRFAVPAVTAAVIDGGELAWGRAWGVREAGGDEPVTTETMFQAGSLSKPVTALLALALVGDGALELDGPINEELHSWKVPDNELSRSAPVTLRHVITHQAGFTPFVYEVPRSEDSMPGMAELLGGGIRGWPAVTVEFLPGSRHAYSNSGYCVLQMVLEDASGLSLHDLAFERVFAPLAMAHSTFDEPLAPELFATVAYGHSRGRGRGRGREPVKVEGGASMAPGAAGGLWSTSTDLARLAVEVMRAWRGESQQLLTTELARQVMTPQIDDFGLGFFLEGEGETLRALHGGNMSGFIANMVLYPDAGKGAVVISNSEAGRWLNRELIAAIATEYDWPGYPVRRRAGTVTAEQMRELAGTYGVEGFSDATFSVWVEGSRLLGKLSGGQPFEMTPTTDEGLFVLPSESLEMLFHRASDGTIEKVTVRRAGESGNVYDRLDV